MSACSPWATEADLCSPCNDYDVLGPIAGDMLQAASDVLYELSGRQFPGLCDATVRPCPKPCTGGGVLRTTRGSGRCGCGGDLCTGRWYQADLGAYPIQSVTEVKVDGVVVDASKYRLDDRRRLVRLRDADGTNLGWPTTQAFDLPDTEEGTWSVSYTWGREPPEMGVRAAAVLACELALSCDPENGGTCRLPRNVTSASRDGITIQMSPQELADTIMGTGMWEVENFLLAYNPKRLRQAASVWWPGSRHVVRSEP